MRKEQGFQLWDLQMVLVAISLEDHMWGRGLVELFAVVVMFAYLDGWSGRWWRARKGHHQDRQFSLCRSNLKTWSGNFFGYSPMNVINQNLFVRYLQNLWSVIEDTLVACIGSETPSVSCIAAVFEYWWLFVDDDPDASMPRYTMHPCILCSNILFVGFVHQTLERSNSEEYSLEVP